MKHKLIILLFSIFSVACSGLLSSYNIDSRSKSYNTKNEAAIAFYKQNISKIKGLDISEELLGWIVQCGDSFKFTNNKIGGVRNVINPSLVNIMNCNVSAHLHTHPKGVGSYDYFSKGDLGSSRSFRMYLLSSENCHIRYADKDSIDDRGTLLGKIKC